MDPAAKAQASALRTVLGKVAAVYRFYPGVPFPTEPYFWRCGLCGALGTAKTEPKRCPSCQEDWADASH